MVVALAVEHADRAEHLAAGPFQGIADVEAHPVGQNPRWPPETLAEWQRVLDHQLAVVVEHSLAIEHGVQIVLAPDSVEVALGAATHQDRVRRTLGSHDQACRHPGEPCRQVDHALPLGQRLGRDLGQHGRHGRRSDDHRRRAVCEGTGVRRARSGGLPRGRGRVARAGSRRRAGPAPTAAQQRCSPCPRVARRLQRAGTDRGRGLLVNGIRTRASVWTQGDSMPSHDRGARPEGT